MDQGGMSLLWARETTWKMQELVVYRHGVEACVTELVLWNSQGGYMIQNFLSLFCQKYKIKSKYWSQSPMLPLKRPHWWLALIFGFYFIFFGFVLWTECHAWSPCAESNFLNLNFVVFMSSQQVLVFSESERGLV